MKESPKKYPNDKITSVTPEYTQDASDIKLSYLNLLSWRQFSHVHIDFHDSLTILTGANGTGKTSLLHLISKNIGCDFNFSTTSRQFQYSFKESREQHTQSSLRFHTESNQTLTPGDEAEENLSFENPVIGAFSYTNSRNHPPEEFTSWIEAVANNSHSQELAISVSDPARMHGVFRGADKPVYKYLDPICRRNVKRHQWLSIGALLLMVFSLIFLFSNYSGFFSSSMSIAESTWPNILSVFFFMIFTLSTITLFGATVNYFYYSRRLFSNSRGTPKFDVGMEIAQLLYNKNIDSSSSSAKIDILSKFSRFKKVILKLLPEELSVDDIIPAERNIYFVTRNNFVFPIDAVSHGIGAWIDIVWSLVHNRVTDLPSLVIIDEPENHLHPKMQKTVLRVLVDEFPLTQFVVATHSPLIINSVENSNVYALKHNADGKVLSEKLDFKEKAGTANDILNEVLGVSFSRPQWAEDRLMDYVSNWKHRLSEETLDDLYSELKRNKLEHLLPNIIDLIEKHNSGNAK